LKGEGSTATLFSPAQISSQHPLYNFTISEQMLAPSCASSRNMRTAILFP
jgi:hypothetical protein